MSEKQWTIAHVETWDEHLTQSAQPIEVTSDLPRPDKNWRFTDAEGHQHFYNKGYPTLEWVVTATYWCEDCREFHDDGEYRCKQCGETIKPRALPAPRFREFIQGPVETTLRVKTKLLLEQETPGTLRGKPGVWIKGFERFSDGTVETELFWSPEVDE